MLSIPIATFGERLRLARFATGMTRKGLADAVGVSVGSIDAYESRGVYPRLSTVVTITQALGVSLEWMMDSDGRRVLEVDAPLSVNEDYAVWMANAIADGAATIDARSADGRVVATWWV